MVSGHSFPQPPVTHPETPVPLCPTPSASLLTQVENYFELGEYGSIEMERGFVQKRAKFKKLSLFSKEVVRHWKS